jgi:UDP-GlcNAc3NAcA epimerase
MEPLRVLTVVGARPQFIKAAMVSRAIVRHNAQSPASQIKEEIIHTGQHYDENMSDVFFREMEIPEPAVRLDCGGKSHGAMTGQMLEAVEKEIVSRRPDWVLVYGDTNSTLAGALAAAKLHVAVAHVEAGLRSYNKKMPEEINRVLTDHVSTLLFCPTQTAVENLRREDLAEGIHHVGDVMYDAALFFGGVAEKTSTMLRTLNLRPKSYYLATIHRQENTDDGERLAAIFEAFDTLATEQCPIIVPLHPRTRLRLLKNSLVSDASGAQGTASDEPELTTRNEYVHLVPSVSYLDMVALEKNASLVLTDSGGVQKEAYWHRVPCVTLRDETEWVETVQAGWNTVVGVDVDRIIKACRVPGETSIRREHPPLFGKGNTAELICNVLLGQDGAESDCEGR